MTSKGIHHYKRFVPFLVEFSSLAVLGICGVSFFSNLFSKVYWRRHKVLEDWWLIPLQQITQVNKLVPMSIIMHYIPTHVSGIAGVWKQWRRSCIKIFICLNLITISLAFTDGGRFNPLWRYHLAECVRQERGSWRAKNQENFKVWKNFDFFFDDGTWTCVFDQSNFYWAAEHEFASSSQLFYHKGKAWFTMRSLNYTTSTSYRWNMNNYWM